MTAYLRIVLGLVVVIYFLLILHFMKRKMLSLKYTLLWLLSGFAMGILVIFPGLLDTFVKILGIATPVYGLFVFAIFFLLVIAMSLTAIVSRQTERIKDLAQENAVLEKRVRELEGKLEYPRI
mgnify:FL=1